MAFILYFASHLIKDMRGMLQKRGKNDEINMLKLRGSIVREVNGAHILL